jgi:CYTH domain-containing protein
LDVFDEKLAGLVYAEVEFTSEEEMTAYEAPAWFGDDVTEDGRYTNASLARHGLPSRSWGCSPPTARSPSVGEETT